MKNKWIAVTAAIFAMLTTVNASSFDMQDINDLKKKVEEKQMSGDFGLSNDFFQQNYESELQMLNSNLDDAQRKYDFSYKMETLEGEYENAEYKYKDEASYVIANKGDDDVKYILGHIIICAANQLKADDESFSVYSEDGKKCIAQISMEPDQIHLNEEGEGNKEKTSGFEMVLNNNAEFYTPTSNLEKGALLESGAIGIWKATAPFFWQAEDVLGGEIGEKELPEKVNMALGMVTSGEYYLFYSEEGANTEDVAILLASYGCTYATGLYGNWFAVNGERLSSASE